MATLDDIRDAGYTVALAYQSEVGLPDVYRIEDEQEPGPATVSYLPDEPAALGAFLADGGD